MNRRIRIFNIIGIALSLLGIVLLLTVLHPCPNGMICKKSTYIFIGLIVTNILLQILSLYLKKKWINVISLLILPIGLILDISIVGTCKVDTMRCNTITFPSMILITFVLSIINFCKIILNKTRELKNINCITLTLKNIKRYSFRYSITFLILLLVNVFVFASSILIGGAVNGIETAKNKIGADLVISKKTENFDELAENIMYDGLPKTLFVDKKYEKVLKDIPHVTNITSRLYLATLEGASCCDDQVQLIATDFKEDFLLSTVVSTKELNDNEIILGSKFKAGVGEKVKYYGREFVVKEKIEKTSTGYDLSGFISYNSAKDIMQDKQYSDIYGNIEDNITSIIFINSDNPEVTKNIIESKYGKELSVYSMNSKLSGYISTVSGIKKLIYVLDMFLIIISFCAIFGITIIATDMRRNELGSMLLIGKTKTYTWKIFMLEQLLVSMSSVIMTIIITIGIKNLFVINIENLINAPIVNNFSSLIVNSLIICALDFVISIISTGIAVIKLYKIDLSELIKVST